MTAVESLQDVDDFPDIDGDRLVFFGLPVLLVAQIEGDFLVHQLVDLFAVGSGADPVHEAWVGPQFIGIVVAVERVVGKVVVVIAAAEHCLGESAGEAALVHEEHLGVIGDGGIHAGAPAQVGNGGVFKAQRAPADLMQGVAAGHHGAAHGQSWHVVAVGVFKEHAFAGELVDVGGLAEVATVASGIVELPCVEHADYGIFRIVH